MTEPLESRGRPYLINDEVIKAICQRVAAGIPDKYAAIASGISDRTLLQWKKKGREDVKAGLETPFSALVAGIKEAESQWIQTALVEVRAAGMGGRKIVETTTQKDAAGAVLSTTTKERTTNGDWRAMITLLERRFPDEFGPDRKEMADLRKLVAELLDRLDGKK